MCATRLAALAVVTTLFLAGCAGTTTMDQPLPALGRGDENVALTGIVQFSPTERVDQAEVRVYRPDQRFWATTTGPTGEFVLHVPRLAACHLEVHKTGLAKNRFEVSCLESGDLLLEVKAAAVVPTLATSAPQGAPDRVQIIGSLLSRTNNHPFVGVPVHYSVGGNPISTLRTGPQGTFVLEVPRNEVEIRVKVDCFRPYVGKWDVNEGMQIGILLQPLATERPAPPANLKVTPGPGHGQITLHWQASSAAGCDTPYRHRVERASQAPGQTFQPSVDIGNSQAFTDSGAAIGATRYYRVSAVNRYEMESDPSPMVSGSPAVRPLPATNVAFRDLNLNVREANFTVLDAAGNELGEKRWRVVRALGNCCENYLASTAAGRLLDFGGTYLRFSDDEGVTWKEVATPVNYLTGEGAVAAAPNGDIVAVGWSPYSGDQLWAHRYSASDKQWSYAPFPHHGPFYDRPWIGTIKGPFEKDGKVVPYVSIVRSRAAANGYITSLSLDGLHYETVTQSSIEATLSTGRTNALPPWLPMDPERDWLQTHISATTSPIGNGIGLYATTTTGACTNWLVLTKDLTWTCPTGTAQFAANERPFTDSLGRIHVVSSTGTGYTYRLSPDMGRTWNETKVALPDGWRNQQWDYKVHSASGRTILSAHVQTNGDNNADQDRLYVFTTRDAQPVLQEIFLIGQGDRDSGGGVTSSIPRFDFATMAFLPDGRVAASFADTTHGSPQVAIEI